MDVLQRIDKLKKERGWSDYTLAEKSGLSPSTVANMHRRNTIPSIATLEMMCDAFGITLSEFFSDEESFDDRVGERQVKYFINDIKDRIEEFEENMKSRR